MTDLHVDVDPDALAPGTRLGEFQIERVIGVGGFGIVYLAFDHALERRVALKEYMPSTLAARRRGMQIAVRSQAHAKTFGIGLRSFINEARLLARFDHPALVKVYRFWEDNGTAYMAMRFCEGQTLGAARAEMASPPNEAWLLALADAVLGALEALHREQVYHRDVAPDNIMLQADGGSPMLLDFGAARHVIGDHTQSLTAILKPNFAAIEQYADAGALRQGPWSDIYSLGAVLHFCLIGRAPLPATLRVLRDELPSLLALRAELVAADGSHYSEAFLGAIDAALSVLPEGRPQDAAAFRARLRGAALPAPLAAASLPAAPRAALELRRGSFAPTTALRRQGGAVHAVTTAWATLAPAGDTDGAPGAYRSTSRRSRRTRMRRWLVPGLASVVVAGLVVYGLMAARPPAATPAPLPVLASVTQPSPAASEPAASSAVAAVATNDRAAARPSAVRRTRPTARAACGERNFFSMQFCLDRQCRKPEFARDPECVERLRQQADRSEQRY
ncbi:serine/threonine protein kinase [Rivibacter subsaxonicus]|uniref:Non-specific serine/threonine protein kinase n=1 Tax=Rivibacter subsaxonicus TaxID=457575 RepID=A0A4Q7VNR0_9BURK|nr:serine/threonine-protein kinase [Rivibacter subsaxonicus]RZT97768.1 non-specific serine/threonine protein kinase [Rivibacter subsaxonicus]